MGNPRYVADLNSSMMQREIAEKWSVSQPMVSKHRQMLREVEHG
jgi:predicted XRE-type DNA-binding protein